MGGYVIYVFLGIVGFVVVFWVGLWLLKDWEWFLLNNMLFMLIGVGLLWLGWLGFNGGVLYSVNLILGLVVFNIYVCVVMSLLIWMMLDVFVFGKLFVIGVV